MYTYVQIYSCISLHMERERGGMIRKLLREREQRVHDYLILFVYYIDIHIYNYIYNICIIIIIIIYTHAYVL